MDVDGVIDSPPVTVACVAPQNPNVPCVTWLLAPQIVEGTSALFRFQIRMGNQERPAEFIGTFRMPFSQTFTRR